MKRLILVSAITMLSFAPGAHAEDEGAEESGSGEQSSQSIQDESRSFTSIIRALGLDFLLPDSDEDDQTASVSSSNIDTALQLGPR